MQISWRLINIIDCGFVGDNKTQKKQAIINNDTTKETLCIDFLGENVPQLAELELGIEVNCIFKSAINMWTGWAIFNRIAWTKIVRFTSDN